MEKLIEAMYDDLAASCDPEMRRRCPMLRRVAEYLIRMKTENNGRIITEFRLVGDGEWDCECH